MSQNQPTSSEDEETRVSFTKKELKDFVIQTVHQLIENNFEPMISRIVDQQLELAGEKLLSRTNHHSGIGVQSSESSTLQLEFMDKLSLPVMTNLTIKGEGPTPLRVALVDATTKQVVTSGIEASAKVEIVVVKGDFDGNNWTSEEFNNMIVKAMEGKKSLLNGNVHLNLEKGVGFVREISFTHNSHWMKVCELRIGAKVADDLHGTRVRAAVTESFVLKDFRQTYTKKHFPPSLNDEVWRLKKISRDGPFHKRLVNENIKTVKDFLTRFFLDPQSLQNILGTAKMWEAIVDHAQTCILDKSLHLYFPFGSEEIFCAVFNVVGQVMGLISECRYVPLDKLSEDLKEGAHNMVIAAFKNWKKVVSFDDESSLINASKHWFSNAPYANSADLLVLTSQKIGGFDNPQTSLCSLDTIPFGCSMGGVNSLDDFGLHDFDHLELGYDESIYFQGQVANSPVCEPEDVHLQSIGDDCSLQYENSCLHTAVNAFLLPRSAAFAQRRWSVVFSVLKWFSILKIVACRQESPCQKKAKISSAQFRPF